MCDWVRITASRKVADDGSCWEVEASNAGEVTSGFTPGSMSMRPAVAALIMHNRATIDSSRNTELATKTDQRSGVIVGPSAKVIMHDAGIFNGADLLVRSHGVTETSRSRAGFGSCCLNINEVKYTFLGRPSHQMASWLGRNALEAAVHFYTLVDRLRSTLRPEASIQGVIPAGGEAPNVVPQRAIVDYYIRYPDPVYLEHVTEMMNYAAQGAALATGTTVEIDRYGEYRDGISLGTLQELAFAYAGELDAPRMNPEPTRPSGYEETGVVTKDISDIGISVFRSRGASHTRGMLDDTYNEIGYTGFRISAEIYLDARTVHTIKNSVVHTDGAVGAVHVGRGVVISTPRTSRTSGERQANVRRSSSIRRFEDATNGSRSDVSVLSRLLVC